MTYLRRFFLNSLFDDFVLVDPLRDSPGSLPRAFPKLDSLFLGPPEKVAVTPRLPGFRSVDIESFRFVGDWDFSVQRHTLYGSVACNQRRRLFQ